MAESEARTVARGLRWSEIKSFQVSFKTMQVTEKAECATVLSSIQQERTH